MPISYLPQKGQLLHCDFNTCFKVPEMTKRRVVVVLSPPIKARPGLCTVVALSTTPPETTMPYHAQIDIRPRLPQGLDSDGIWIKGDMVNAVAFHRLDLIRIPHMSGRRVYYEKPLTPDQMETVHRCVLHGMGLSKLTRHL